MKYLVLNVKMDLNELIVLKQSKVAELSQLLERGQLEKRELTTEEAEMFSTIENEVRQLESQIIAKNNIKTNPIIIKNEKKMNKFSLTKAIEARANGRNLDEAAVAVIEAGKIEMRNSGLSYSGDIQLPLDVRAAIVAGTDNSGQDFIGEDKIGMIEPIRNSLVLVQAGAEFLTGLTGDVSIPAYAGTSALWKGETTAAGDGAGATSEITLSPKRLTTYIDVSKQFLAQNSPAVEAMLMRDIVNAITEKLESTVFGKEAGSSTQPAGFFASAPTIKGTATWANIVAAETAVDTANLLKQGKYITNAGGRAILKTTAKVSGQPVFLMDADGMVNGYPCLVSNAVAKQLQTGTDEFGVVFGDWSQFIVGQWGAIDLVVDGLSQAINGNVRIVINAYFDAKARNSSAFSAISIK